MILIQQSILIYQPVSKVFEYLRDIRAIPEWRHDVLEVTYTDFGSVTAGSIFHEVVSLMGKRVYTMQVVEVNEPYDLSIQALSGPYLLPHQLFHCEPRGNATLVTFRGEVEPTTRFIFLLSPLLSLILQQKWQVYLQKLKQNLETALPVPPTPELATENAL